MDIAVQVVLILIGLGIAGLIVGLCMMAIIITGR